jgi:hypothetical protein
VGLAIAVRGMFTKAGSFVMLLCTVMSLIVSSTTLGFLCAVVTH